MPNSVAWLVFRFLPRFGRVWLDADPFDPMGRWGNKHKGRVAVGFGWRDVRRQLGLAVIRSNRVVSVES